jgi:PAP2 superfamily
VLGGHAALLLLAGVAGILALSVLAAAAPRRWRAASVRLTGWPLLERLRRQRAGLAAGLGAGCAYAALLLAGIPLLVFACWLPGMLSQHRPLALANRALLDWFAREQATAPQALVVSMRAVTRVGEWPEVLVVSALAAAVLALAARRRRWLPPLLIATALVAERYLQKVIGALVAEPHLPGHGLGVYPSGGAARMVAVHGLIAWLCLRRWARGGWRPTVAVWTGVALLAFGVGFARAFLLLHWPIDIPGGLLFGVLLLGLLVAAAGAFEPEGVPDPAEAAEAPAAPQAITARHP